MSTPPPVASPGVRLRADLVLVGITVLWGGTFVVVKDALDQADPFSFVAMRFAIGGLLGTLIARRQLLAPGVLKYGVFLGLFLFLGFALQTQGLLFTTESRSAFITGLAVILVPVVSIAVFRRLPKPPSIVGVVIALIGLYFLTGGLSLSGERDDIFWGDLLTLGCAVSFAFHIAFTEVVAPKVPALALVAVQLWTVSILAALCIPFVTTRIEWSGSLVFALIFTGVFASTTAIALQTWAQARTTAVRAALVFALEPVFAATFSVLLGRGTLQRHELVGGLLTVLAIVIAEAGNIWWARREQARFQSRADVR